MESAQLTVLKPVEGGIGVTFREVIDGLIVSGVDDGSPGAAGGLQVDDIVSSINGSVTRKIAAAREAVKSARGEIKITLHRKVRLGEAARERPASWWKSSHPACGRRASLDHLKAWYYS